MHIHVPCASSEVLEPSESKSNNSRTEVLRSKFQSPSSKMESDTDRRSGLSLAA